MGSKGNRREFSGFPYCETSSNITGQQEARHRARGCVPKSRFLSLVSPSGLVKYIIVYAERLVSTSTPPSPTTTVFWIVITLGFWTREQAVFGELLELLEIQQIANDRVPFLRFLPKLKHTRPLGQPNAFSACLHPPTESMVVADGKRRAGFWVERQQKFTARYVLLHLHDVALGLGAVVLNHRISYFTLPLSKQMYHLPPPPGDSANLFSFAYKGVLCAPQ